MNQTESVSTIAVSEFDTRGLDRGERFDAWRDSFAPLFDVQRGADADRGDFLGVVKAYTLAGLVIAESACPTKTIWRGHRGPGAASDGIAGDDPLVLHLHQAGTSRGRNGEREM